MLLKNVIHKIRERFGYVFEKLVPEANGFYYKPCLVPNEINSEFTINELKIQSFEQDHGLQAQRDSELTILHIVQMF